MVSILLALMLLVLPLPTFIQWVRPNWVLLVLLFWVLNAPMLVGLGWYWLIGLFQDLVQATPFGLHALSYTLLVFFFTQLSFRLTALPMWQQLVALMILSVLNAAITYFISIFFSIKIDFVFGINCLH